MKFFRRFVICRRGIICAVFLSAAILAVYFSRSTCAAGLVPCTDNCNLCYLIIGISNIFQYLMGALLGAAFLLAITIAGLTLIVAGLFPKVVNFAKTAFANSLKGFVLALCCWIIINGVMNIVGYKHPLGGKWYQFECSSGTCTSSNKTLQSIKIKCSKDTSSTTASTSTTGSSSDSGSGFYVTLDTLSGDEVKKTQQLKAVGTYSCDGTTSEEDITSQVEWKSSDETQIKVAKGLVAAVSKSLGSSSESVPYVEAKYKEKSSNQAKVYINSCPNTTASIETNDKFSLRLNNLLIPKAHAEPNSSFNDSSSSSSDTTGIGTTIPSADTTSSSTTSDSLADAVCAGCGQTETTCHYVVGNRDSAKYIFVLMRSNDWFWKDKTENACETKVERWQKEDDADLKKFKDKVKKFAEGYQYLNDTDGDFAIYESTQIGSWDSTCPPGKKYYGYGYVYKGTGNRAAAHYFGHATYCMDEENPAQAFAHEQPGHSFADLDDEYTNSKENPNKFSWKPHLNCTVDPSCAKWGSKKDGCELGCSYAEYSIKSEDNGQIGFYRSSENSIMNLHYSASSFDTLNSWIIKYKADNGYLPSSVNQNGQPPLVEKFPAVKYP